MILVDVNIALYAIDRSNPGHEVSRTWFEEALSGDEEIRFALSSLLGFLRISTNPGTPISRHSRSSTARRWRRPTATSPASLACGRSTRWRPDQQGDAGSGTPLTSPVIFEGFEDADGDGALL